MSYSLKEGHLQKWSDSKNRFNPVYAKLLSSGWFQWFESQGSQSPKRSIDVRTVAPFIAFTTTLYQVPCRPSSIGDSDIQRAFGMPHEPHKGTKMSFFVCPDVNELSAWVNAITGLLQPAQSGIPSGAVGPPYASAPPPYQPAPSSGGIGFGGYPSGPVYPAYPPAPSAPPPPPGGVAAPPAYPMPPGGYGGQPAPPSAYPPPNYPPTNTAYGQPAAGYSAPPQPAPGASGGYASGAAAAGAAAGAYGAQQQQQPYYVDKNGKPYTVIYKDGKPKKKKWKDAAIGLAAGAAGGYLAGKMFSGFARPFGGGWGGGWGGYGGGWGGRGWGSWSSLSSFSSLSWSD